MTIAVDFDGVLTPAGCWPGVGEPNTKLIDRLKGFRKKGGKLILWTSRTGDALDLAVEFCRQNGLEFDAVNANLPETIRHFGNEGRKITADLYIDDKARQVIFAGGRFRNVWLYKWYHRYKRYRLLSKMRS